jgi:hypothetical protein
MLQILQKTILNSYLRGIVKEKKWMGSLPNEKPRKKKEIL